MASPQGAPPNGEDRGEEPRDGSRLGVRRLRERLAYITTDDAVLIGDSVTPGGEPEISLRIRNQDEATPWWRQYNIPAVELPEIVAGTGWLIDTHLQDGADHAVLLRKDS